MCAWLLPTQALLLMDRTAAISVVMLEIRVPISPKPYFFRQVECLYRSAQACGGLTGNVRIVVSIGEDMEPYDVAAAQPWSDTNVIWRWAEREEVRKLGHHAAVLDRFKVESDAATILLADADTLFVNGVDDLLESLKTVPAVAGVMAHGPPFVGRPNETWETIFKKLGRSLPSDLHQHTGWGTMFQRHDVRFSPIYYNFGAVFVPGPFLSALADAYRRQLVVAERANVGYFVGQLALTLAIYELDLPRIALPPRYNFPNDPLFEAQYPEDLADLRILHYLRLDEVQRDKIWQSPDDTLTFLARRNLRPSNEALRRTVEKLWNTKGGLSQARDTPSSSSRTESATNAEIEKTPPYDAEVRLEQSTGDFPAKQSYDQLPIKPSHVDLLIIDDIVPSTFSPFRTIEYGHYLNFFDCAVLSLEGWHGLIGNISFDELVGRFPAPPNKRRRILSFKDDAHINARLAYVTFLNTAYRLMPYFRERSLPFILQLYPGGGFQIEQPDADNALREVLLSDLCRGVIVTQTLTRDYILNQIGCDPQKVTFVFGGVFDSRVPFDFSKDKKFYPTHKDTLDLCFVAHKYVDSDIKHKGYDRFVEIAQRLAPEYPHLRLHVVGNYDASDLPLSLASDRFTFYGRQDSRFFEPFFPRMDAIISINRPFSRRPGIFDGFPTGSCIEAGFRGVLNCINDPLNLNPVLVDGRDFLLLNDDTDQSVSTLRGILSDSSRLYALAYANWRKFHEVFDVNAQLWARSRVIAAELSKQPVDAAKSAEMEKILARNAEVEARLGQATAALAAIESATSWRITQPIRQALGGRPRLPRLLRRGAMHLGSMTRHAIRAYRGKTPDYES
jgi:glycosyltransferase involved in cell wall biosynthesis